MVNASKSTGREPTGREIPVELARLLEKLHLDTLDSAIRVFERVADAKVKMTVNSLKDLSNKLDLRDISRWLNGENICLDISGIAKSLEHEIGLNYMCEIFLSGNEEFTKLLLEGSERVPGARYYESWYYNHELTAIFHDFCQPVRG